MVIDLRIIDLSYYDSSTASEQARLSSQLVEALEIVGFVGIKVDGFEDLIKKIYAYAKKYFSLPPAEKLKDKAMTLNGYHPLQQESLGKLDGIKVAEIEHKEAYLIVGEGKKPSLQGAECIDEFRTKLTFLANKILHIIHGHYGISPNEESCFEESSSNAVTRITRYAPLKEAPSNSIWCAAHHDISPFALMPRATQSGLQLACDGKWLDVVVPENTVILNTGRFFEAMTAGLIKPTRHRVYTQDLSSERYSVIQFPCWRPDFFLKPWESCLKRVQQQQTSGPRSLLNGKVSDLFEMFITITNQNEPEKEKIQRLARDLPSCVSMLRERWPNAFDVAP